MNLLFHLRKRTIKFALHTGLAAGRLERGSKQRPGRPDLFGRQTGYTGHVRAFSLLFAFIALVLLAQFVIFVSRVPVEDSFTTFVAGALFVGFLLCLIPALLLLKPFGSREDLRRRRETRAASERRAAKEKDPPEDQGP